MSRTRTLLALLAMSTSACGKPKDPTDTSCGVLGGRCSPDGASCSPAAIGTGWAHMLQCQGGKWEELEIAPLPPRASAPPSQSAAVAPAPTKEPEKPLTVVARILTRLPDATWDPRRLRLTSFRQADGALELQCEALDLEDVAEFVRRLSSAPGFTAVTLLAGEKHGEGENSRVTTRIAARVTDADRVTIASAKEAGTDFGTGNRNPFEALASRATSRKANAVAENVALTDLKLLGVVVGQSPHALLTDPTGRGLVVKPGDTVGQTDANDPEACRWRVDQIGESAVTFVRSDAGACAASPKTRTIKLAP